MKKFFNNSVSQFASYFTANAKLSQKQLKELRDMIDLEIEKNKKMDSSKIILLLGISFLCWLIYKSVLADHKLFVFNRFFLLGTVVISLAIPFIQIDIARENNPVTRTVNLYYIQEVIIGKAPQPSFNWYKIVAYGYIVITVFLLFALYWAYFKLLTGFIKTKRKRSIISIIYYSTISKFHIVFSIIYLSLAKIFFTKTSNLKYYSMSRLIFFRSIH